MEQYKKNKERHNSMYNDKYQPAYDDLEKLEEACHELAATTSVTSYEHLMSIREQLKKLAIGETDTPLIMAGPCAEYVRLNESPRTIAEGYNKLYEGIKNEHPHAIAVIRGCGQAAKPRSQEMEDNLPSYYGDMINGEEKTLQSRRPDPSRMVATALQSRDIESYLSEWHGDHIAMAHEALLLMYEKSFMKELNNQHYIASGDMLWIGDRTRKPDGEHVKLLTSILNPVGIKVGPNIESQDVARLSQTLNPHNHPGKLSFIIRFGAKEIKNIGKLLDVIAEEAPNCLIVSDPCHGNTREVKNIHGIAQKTRVVEDMVTEIMSLSTLCRERNIRLHGLHLEAVAMGDHKKQCVDQKHHLPNTISSVDPQLNLTQLRRVLKETRDYLL